MATINGTASGEVLNGTADSDTINGLGGDDTIYVGVGNDTANGGDGDDDIYGATAGDIINGGAGTDWFSLDLQALATSFNINLTNVATGTVAIGATGTTLTQVETGYIYFGAGNDIVTLGTSLISIRPGDGNDTVTGGVLGDVLYGNDGNDTLNGLGGDDTFYAEDGADTVNGGDGDDDVYGATAGDIINGGAGTDWISMDLDTVLTALTVDLTNAATGTVNIGATGSSLTQVETGYIYFGIANDIVTLGTSLISVRPGDGNDTVTGGVLGDVLYGNDGNDTLNGLGGDDTFYAEDGADTVNGGDGDDDVYGATAGDKINGGAGTDWFSLDLTNQLTAFTVDLTNAATGTVAIGATGSTLTQVETGYIYFGAGNDIITLGTSLISARGGAGNDTVTGGVLADVLYGNDGNDTLNGLGGADTFYGEDGDDTMDGGLGNDSLYAGNGLDTASYASITGGAVSIVLVETGTGTHTTGAGGNDYYNSIENLTGTAFADSLTGNSSANVLNGGAGNDTLTGNDGNDSYYVDSAGDVVVEAAGLGTDRVFASASYTLTAGLSIETLTTNNSAGSGAINLTANELANSVVGNNGANTLNGGAGNDTIQGLGGNDVLIGGTGVDSLAGGLGDDMFYVDNVGDTVSELAGQGTDRIFSSVNFTLAAGLHVERLTTANNAGTTAINFNGNELVNQIYGNNGVNVLDGKVGNDTMVGAGGDDTYYVDSSTDAVIEAVGGGTTDRVFATVSYTLLATADVERLQTTNNAGTAAINLGGSNIANLIYGNAGANVLDGRGGADLLSGLGGNDSYYVDNAADAVVEAVGGGTDRVYAHVSYALGAGVQVETLTTSNNAGTGAINLTGNEIANQIYGNAGANVLDGKGGADLLVGLQGADTFAFTTALGGGNVDAVSGFVVADDTIRLENAVFTGLAAGALAAGAFNTGAAATQADDRIIYNSATGALLFDADGLGGAAGVQFATLAGGLALTGADFVVV